MGKEAVEFCYRGVKITLRKTEFKVVTSFELFLTKGGSRLNKFVSPDADVLPVLKDLCPFRFTDSGEVIQQRSYPLSAYLIGILRALMVLKVMDPSAYKKVVEAAKYLSYEVDDAVRVPTLAFLQQGVRFVDRAFAKVYEVSRVSKEKYIKEVARSFVETGLFKDVALFTPNAVEDEAEYEKFMNEEPHVPKEDPSPIVEIDEETKKTFADMLEEELRKIRAAFDAAEEF
jgi:hypothetical protein